MIGLNYGYTQGYNILIISKVGNEIYIISMKTKKFGFASLQMNIENFVNLVGQTFKIYEGTS